MTVKRCAADVVQYINTFAPGLIQAVHAKTAGSHMALVGNFSVLVSTINPVKSSKKDLASLVVCTPKKFFWIGVADFL